MKQFKVTVDGQTYTVQVEEIEAATASGAAAPAGNSQPAPAVQNSGPQTGATPAGNPQQAATSAAAPQVEAAPAPAPGGAGTSVKAPMPGSVLEVKVKVGQAVQEGDVLLVLEAMKMENELTAPQGGTVSGVMVKQGDTVNSGDPLITIS